MERRLEEVPVLGREEGSDELLVLGREEERELVGRTENLESGFRWSFEREAETAGALGLGSPALVLLYCNSLAETCSLAKSSLSSILVCH